MDKGGFASVKYVTTAGEALNPEVYNRFYELTGLKLLEAFGQTETTGMTLNLEGTTPTVGSLGSPSPLYDVRLVGDGSEPVPPSVREGIIKAVHDDFHGLSPVSGNSRVGLASTVYASRFYMSVMAVEGVKNLHAIAVALGDGALNYADLVAVNGDQEPVLARENISIDNGG